MSRRFQPLSSIAELGSLRQRLASERLREQARSRRIAAQQERDRVEADLFRNAVGVVAPLRETGRREPERPQVPATARQRERDEQAALAESLSDEIDLASYLDTDDALSFRRPEIGPDVPRRLRRGDWTVVAQVDLHGLRVDEARVAVGEFLAECRKRGQRCVRIVHGKGLGSVNREPVLREKVMRWLVQRRDVLAFCRARPNDGGSGALIVLLSGR